METVQELINELNSLTDEQKKLPIFIYSPSGDLLNISMVDKTVTDRIDINTEYQEEIEGNERDYCPN